MHPYCRTHLEIEEALEEIKPVRKTVVAQIDWAWSVGVFWLSIWFEGILSVAAWVRTY